MKVEKKILNPKKTDSAIVGVGLFLFGLFYFFKTGMVEYELPTWIEKHSSWIIPSIFILRAIGDFKYIGFFKKIKQTEFAEMDTKFYSPLCLVIGVIGLVVKFL